MRQPSRRPEQVAGTIRQVIADALAREVRDPRVGFVTVTGVLVTNDLSHARVMVSVPGGEAEKVEGDGGAAERRRLSSNPRRPFPDHPDRAGAALRARQGYPARRAHRQRNLDLVAKVSELATAKGCRPSQLALAWLLAQGDDVAPIPGTKKRTRLDENLGAVDVTLTPDDLAAIDAVFPAGAAAASGDRYADMSHIDR